MYDELFNLSPGDLQLSRPSPGTTAPRAVPTWSAAGIPKATRGQSADDKWIVLLGRLQIIDVCELLSTVRNAKLSRVRYGVSRARCELGAVDASQSRPLKRLGRFTLDPERAF